MGRSVTMLLVIFKLLIQTIWCILSLVKILDVKNKPMWVPPSVVLFND